MAKTRDFSYLGAAVVQSMLNNALAALAQASNAQSYSVGNRHQQNAAIEQAAQMVEDCQIALAQINNQASPNAAANFNNNCNARGYY